ncbi:MAG: hypothetical protein JNJ42_18475 [Burkholderiaceae bacterium]|nr:hypothetical protein [Burkholderiaceae bacterium]
MADDIARRIVAPHKSACPVAFLHAEQVPQIIQVRFLVGHVQTQERQPGAHGFAGRCGMTGPHRSPI